MLILLNAFLCGWTSLQRAPRRVGPYSSDVTSAVHVTGSLAECVTSTCCVSLSSQHILTTLIRPYSPNNRHAILQSSLIQVRIYICEETMDLRVWVSRSGVAEDTGRWGITIYYGRMFERSVVLSASGLSSLPRLLPGGRAIFSPWHNFLIPKSMNLSGVNEKSIFSNQSDSRIRG
jgi:hypothetical protein